MDQEKSLTLQPAAWRDSHAALFARALICDPLATPETLRRNVAAGVASLFDVLDAGGAVLGAVVLRVEKRDGGVVGFIDAGAGRLPFARKQFPALIQALQRQFRGVDIYRIETGRRSIIKQFARLGYKPRQVTLDLVAA